MKQLMLVIIVAVACVSASGKVIFVCEGGPGGGESWQLALGSFQRALSIARAGDEIWLKSGTYYPENIRDGSGPQAFATSFIFKDGVQVYGGFRGDETSCGERQRLAGSHYTWEYAHPSILAQHPGNAGSVIVAKDCGGLLDGLVIQGGNAIGTGNDGNGGGICGSGNLRINGCVFRNNRAYLRGGGICWAGQLTMTDSLIVDNDITGATNLSDGGGVSITGDGYALTGCQFRRNGASQLVARGGGLSLDGNGTAEYCTIIDNTATGQGAGAALAKGAQLVHAVVWGNTGCTQSIVVDGNAGYWDCAFEENSQEDDGKPQGMLAVQGVVFYGAVSTVSIVPKCDAPFTLEAFPPEMADIRRGNAENSWQVVWRRAGQVTLRASSKQSADEVSLKAMIPRREIVVVADDVIPFVNEEETPLTWRIVAGQCATGDSLTGALARTQSPEDATRGEIIQGTLNVKDGCGGSNYILRFYSGDWSVYPEE